MDTFLIYFLLQVKFMDIEDELKVVGQNQQTLEVRILLGQYVAILVRHEHKVTVIYMVTSSGNIAMNW